MYEEEKVTTENSSDFGMERRLIKTLRLYLIPFILVVIFMTVAGALYGNFGRKTMYKAEKTVMLITNILNIDKEGNEYSPSIKNDVVLAIDYLPDVAFMIKHPMVIEDANRRYKENGFEGSISGDSVSVDYGEDNLIFSISYLDENDDLADKKLAYIVESARANVGKYVKADKFDILPLQKGATLSVETDTIKFSFLGLIAGVAIVLCISFLKVFTDNTIKEVSELEDISGANFFGYIEDIKTTK